ncbi:MAG TPA: glycosyltransferase family protein [Planktothrix sp.]|jgi:uncharacterized protein (TIGR00661 family)
MPDRKIVYGICGIGRGHTIRQVPIVEHFARQSRLVIFAYGESHKFYSDRYRGHSSITVERVSVPFMAGDANGLDFAASLRRHEQGGVDHFSVNCNAMARAQAILGRPDLVISDYEPVCAQYAYASDAPLVTIDQQSKYLVGDFPAVLGGQTYVDEIARLRMFFPRAQARFACSFFNVPRAAAGREVVDVCAPVLKDSILSMKRTPAKGRQSIVVYISSQRDFVQDLGEVAEICAKQKSCDFHFFVPADVAARLEEKQAVSVYKHGDARFSSLLEQCSGLVTTGGHSLLSEAMHLGMPAYVIPLAVYEQHMNAHVIDRHGFGVSRPCVESQALAEFIEELPAFARAIESDKEVLLRGSGEDHIIASLERQFFLR